jgi:hypothetical protein
MTSRKDQAIDLFILQKQRLVRRLENRVPRNAVEAVHPVIARRHNRAHGEYIAAQGQSQKKKCAVFSHRAERCSRGSL